jgi:hypothetical protein
MIMTTFTLLNEVRDSGRMPRGRIIWLGLGITPLKTNSIKIEINNLPSREECVSIVGLDVILTYCGNLTPYRTLLNLCNALLSARPRRLQVVDVDIKKVAFLKLGGQ